MQVAAHAVGDGQCDDECGDAGGHSGNGDGGDYADDGLPPFGSEVARRNEEFESHTRGQGTRFRDQRNERMIE